MRALALTIVASSLALAACEPAPHPAQLPPPTAEEQARADCEATVPPGASTSRPLALLQCMAEKGFPQH
jgi:hypothetical protein